MKRDNDYDMACMENMEFKKEVGVGFGTMHHGIAHPPWGLFRFSYILLCILIL